MKLLFFLHSFGIGGAERRCAMIAGSFADRGDDVTAVLLDSPEVLYPIENRIRVIFLPAGDTIGTEIKPRGKSWDDPSLALDRKVSEVRSKEDIRSRPNDYSVEDLMAIIRSYSERIRAFVGSYPEHIVISWVTIYSVSCAIALSGLPNRFIFVECNAPGAEFPEDHLFNTLKKKWYPRARTAIFQTEEQMKFYGYLDRTAKYVIANPIRELGIPRYSGERRHIIVNFCRLRKSKRLTLLIDAFDIFRRDHPDYRLHIYGEGPEKDSILDHIRSKALSDCVSVIDFDINVHQKVYDCAMFVSSSLFEGLSNSMLEAMAVGLPVVCTDCRGGGARSVIKNGQNGLLVPVENPVALSEAMKRIADAPKLAEKLSKNAYLIGDKLSGDRILGKWDQAIRIPD